MNSKIVFLGQTKTGKSVVVRYPKMTDLENLLTFINNLSDEKTFVRYQGEHETLESERRFIITRLKEINNKQCVHLLAFLDKELAGVVEIHLKDKTENHIGVLALSVVKKFRNDGLGKILLDSVIKEAKNELKGLKIITLEVYSANKIAHDLYTKMGFVEYGRLPKGISRAGKFEDAILMYKQI